MSFASQFCEEFMTGSSISCVALLKSILCVALLKHTLWQKYAVTEGPRKWLVGRRLGRAYSRASQPCHIFTSRKEDGPQPAKAKREALLKNEKKKLTYEWLCSCLPPPLKRQKRLKKTTKKRTRHQKRAYSYSVADNGDDDRRGNSQLGIMYSWELRNS